MAGLIASLLTANVMLLVLNLPFIRICIKLLMIARHWIHAGILLFATLGTIGVNPSPIDLVQLTIFGLMGYGMRRLNDPIAPVRAGLILGPMAEQQVRPALSIAPGDRTRINSRSAIGETHYPIAPHTTRHGALLLQKLRLR